MPLESVYLNGGFIGVTTNYQIAQAAGTETITYVGSAKSDNSTTIDLTGISMLPGDIVLVISGDDAGAPGTATGYTSLASISSTGDARVMYKIMPDPVDSSVTGLTAGGSDSGHLAVVFRGVNQTTPIDVTTETSLNTAGDPNPDVITTVTDGAMVVALAFLDDDLAEGGITAPSGYTLADANEFGSSGSGGTVMAIYKLVATAGVEDPGIITTNDDDWWWAATVALRPGTSAPIASNDGIFNLQAVLENSTASYNYEAPYGTPDYTVTSFPSTDTGVANSNDVLLAIDATISSTDDGVLVDLGGNTGTGLAVGVNNGTLRARAFDSLDGTEILWNVGTATAYVEVDISAYTGSAATYYVTVDASTFTLSVYVQPGGKGSSNKKVFLGSDAADGTETQVYGGANKGYGQVGTGIADLEAAYEVNFTGTITEIRYWAETANIDISHFGFS